MGLAGGMTEESPEIDEADIRKRCAASRRARRRRPADAQPLLRIEGVSKTFGNFRAVDRLSLDIGAGEFFALLGPSGCGKTTLLRMLAGFETPDEGRILLGGRDIAPVLPHERPVNMMFQNYALFPHLNVRDNIAFGLKRAGMARAAIDDPRRRDGGAGQARRHGEAQAGSAFRRPEAARGAGALAGAAAARFCCSTNRWPRSTRSCARARNSN